MLINRLQIGPGKPIFDVNVASFDPSRIAHTQSERLEAGIRFRIIFGNAQQHAHAPHALGLLRSRSQRPRSCRAAEKADELAPLHVFPWEHALCDS
jgi:hypothetical protein